MAWTAAGLRAIIGNGFARTTIWVALTRSGTEISGNGYARQRVPNGQWSFPSGISSGVFTISNSPAVTFPDATGAITAPDGFAIYSAQTAGVLWGSWDFPDSLSVSNISAGSRYEFASNQLTIPYTAGNFVNRGMDRLADQGLQNTTWYVGLGSGAGGATETSGNGYARRPVGTWRYPSSLTSGKYEVVNDAAINFADPTGNWVTPTHWALWDAASAGRLILRSPLENSPIQPTSQTTVSISAAELKIIITA